MKHLSAPCQAWFRLFYMLHCFGCAESLGYFSGFGDFVPGNMERFFLLCGVMLPSALRPLTGPRCNYNGDPP